MKSKILKIILPAFAILLAVSLSFASTEANLDDATDYYDHPILGATLVPGGTNCPTQGSITCKYNGFDVFDDQGLTMPLFERQ